jgi:hypothetical protein
MINSFQPFGTGINMLNCLLRLPTGNLVIGANSQANTNFGIWIIRSLNVFTSMYRLNISNTQHDTKALLFFQNTTLIAGMDPGWLFFYNNSTNYSLVGNVQTGDRVRVLEQAYPGEKRFFF